MIPMAMRQTPIKIGLFITAIVFAMALALQAQSVDETKRWDRYLDVGTSFYFEGQQDSAKFYLEPVFENDADQKMTAARYLLDIALNDGDTPKINEYALFLAENYDLSINQERQKSHQRIILIVAAAMLVLLIMGAVIYISHKRH